MDDVAKIAIENIHTPNPNLQNQAYTTLLSLTEQPVGWAYQVWDGLLADLKDPDNHIRAIGAQVLCNLAKSDPEKRIVRDFDQLLAVTRDQRFVTARHCMQSLWKIGVAGPEQQATLMRGLEQRFQECATEKNCTLIRYDIIQSLRNVYEATQAENIRTTALAWIETEPDEKYRKKYATLWRNFN